MFKKVIIVVMLVLFGAVLEKTGHLAPLNAQIKGFLYAFKSLISKPVISEKKDIIFTNNINLIFRIKLIM